MDPDVSVYPLPVFLVSLCQRQSVELVSGARVEHFPPPQPTPRRPPRPCCKGVCGGRVLLLVPVLLLLLLGLGACLLLLRRALVQGASRSREPDLLDLLRGENTEEVLHTEDAPRIDATPVSSLRWFPESLPTLAPSTASSELTSSPASTLALTSPGSAPPPLVTTTVSPGSGHARRCNDTEKTYCVNGGDCYYIHGINQLSCKCPNDYTGDRCQTSVMASFYQSLGIEFMEAEELYQKRVLTITGICVALLVVGIVCVVAYCKTNLPPRKQRKKMHNHLRQNIYVDHPNRNLANGPNHPGPGPEEIPMVDYISKNVPATERVIRHGAEAPFPGSRQSSRSHNSSTRAHSSTHRYVSALTTPARLSPVDFHYSLPPQVPTFQITSPNASHAMSLPPAAHAPYPPEEDQPLLRRYQVPLHEARGHEPYRQQQRGSYLRDSTGSLPSSPYRLAQEDEYESTQEYLSSMEQPKRSSRRWRRSRLNGHVAPRGYQPSRDLGSRSCLSDSDSEEEEGESTPFLSMQNMNAAEPSALYRPVPDTRTSHAQSGRHGSRANTQTRLTHSRSKPDNAPH
ncbi:neuregulin 2a isoform X21 [Danio rerio]|uniref:Neuregulin 2a isoform X21 n=1 Tax=Danio rerio TaxID=7955 RepID=A0AC58I7S2_DANRE